MFLKVTVEPGKKADSITMKNGRYMVSVREPAEGGRANSAVHNLLARHLGINPKMLSLFRGVNSPTKLFIRRDVK